MKTLLALPALAIAIAIASCGDRPCTDTLTCEPPPTGASGTGGSGGANGSALGQPCDDGSECTSSFCVDGVCCDMACDGTCEACDSVDTAGTCSASAPGTTDTTCAPGVCDAAGNCAIGDALWLKTFGALDYQRVLRITLAEADDVVIAGLHSGTFNMGGAPLTGTDNVVLAKLDESGNHVWSDSFGDASTQIPFGLASSDTGGIVLTGMNAGAVSFGSATHTALGAFDTFLAKFSSAGVLAWSQGFGEASTFQSAIDVAVDATGAVTLGGWFNGTLNFGGNPLTSGGNDGFIAKFNAFGGHSWSRRVDDSNGMVQDVRGVAVDDANNVVFTGNFQGTINLGGGAISSVGQADVFLAKFAPDGSHLWSRRVGEADVIVSTDVSLDAQSNILLTGSFDGTVVLGDITLNGQGANDAYVVKFDPLGEALWAHAFGNFNEQDARGVAADSAGNVYVCGSFTGSMVVGDTTLSSVGADDAFVIKLAPSGEPLWAKQFGDAAEQVASSVIVDSNDNALVGGWFDGTIDVGTASAASQGDHDMFLFKLSP